MKESKLKSGNSGQESNRSETGDRYRPFRSTEEKHKPHKKVSVQLPDGQAGIHLEDFLWINSVSITSVLGFEAGAFSRLINRSIAASAIL